MAEWRQTRLLTGPGLAELARAALERARGRRIDANEPFPAMLWLGGAEDTWGGRPFLGTVEGVVNLLHQRAAALAPKRQGWVIEPVTNPTGRRTNAETRAMHALFLDADGTGEWDALLRVLCQLGYAFVAYQSGGWTPAVPKWRVVFPLHAPHDTSTEAGQLAWKAVYNHARVVFGTVAELLCVGFDPATETPACPWFLTERRNPADPTRQIVWNLGHSLDLTGLALALPEVVVEEERPSLATSTTRTTASRRALNEERLVEIIDSLAKVTNNIPSGRRDLYLALPGALLDRGVSPDDVMAIIEGVSSSYPRPHADKHFDNLHNARTTVGRYLCGERYTRIGTLQELAPQVAAVVDQVLPDLVTKGITDAITAAMLSPTHQRSLAATGVQIAPVVVSTSSARRRRAPLTPLGHDISQIAARLKASTKQRQEGLLIGCFVDNISLPEIPGVSLLELSCTAVRALGRHLPLSVQWQDVLDFINPSLLDLTRSAEHVAVIERVFYEGRGRRNKSNTKKAAIVAERNAQRRDFFDGFMRKECGR